ncbi:hypothetical protein EBQ91_00860, partial [bacterium]|nr:hypothetical protein [bacterium]
MQSFLSPQVQYRRIYSTGSQPTAGITDTVAYIYATPAGSPPTIASGRNWLKNSVNIRNNGNQRTNSGQYELWKNIRQAVQRAGTTSYTLQHNECDI